MTPDPELIAAAIRRKDAGGVRDLLRHADEAGRQACLKVTRGFRNSPVEWQLVPVTFGERTDWHHCCPDCCLDEEHAARREEQERAQAEHSAIQQSAALLAATLGSARSAQAALRAAQDHSSWDPLPGADLEALAGVLADRQPPWLADFVHRHLREPYQLGLPSWPLARRLVQLGAIDRPEQGEYTTRMPDSLCAAVRHQAGEKQLITTVADELRRDPGLLDVEVWRLFTVPDAAWQLDRCGQAWTGALALLAEEGLLDRGRLLDACLDALTMDFLPTRVGWYVQFHDRLNPTLAEMQERAGRYLVLLGAGSKHGVVLGQRGTAALLAAGLLDCGRFLAGSGPALLFPQKSVALAQLRLIGKVAAADPGRRAQAVTAAAEAFGHQRQDIQEAALALLRRYGAPGGEPLRQVRSLAAALSPALAGDAAALGISPVPDPAPATPAGAGTPGQPGVPAPAGAPGQPGAGAADNLAGFTELQARIEALPARQVPPLRALLTAARRGDVAGPARVAPSAGSPVPDPVHDPEELIGLLSVLMEDASDPVMAERALAGAVRLSVLPLHHRAQLAAPLLKRARAQTRYWMKFRGDSITRDVAYLTEAWGAGQLSEDEWDRPAWPRNPQFARVGDYWREEYRGVSVSETGRPMTMAGIFTARVWEAARIICARPGPGQAELLAEPDSSRGAVSAGRLLDRLSRRAATGSHRRPARLDLEAAVLRLGPDAGQDFWAQWARIDKVTAERARRAYASSQTILQFEPVTGPPLGQNHVRGYSGWHPHVLARLVPGPAGQADTAGQSGAGSLTWELLTALSDPMASHRIVYGPSAQNRQYGSVVAAWPLICPWQPDLAAAHLLRPLSDGLKPGLSPATTALHALAHAGHPLGPVGHLALAAGLASGEADTRIAAAEVWSAACVDGRLDPALAADAITEGTSGHAFKLNRVTSALEQAGHVPLAAYRITEMTCLAYDRLAQAAVPGRQLLLGLAARLSALTGAGEVPDGITGLARRRGRNQETAAAARLLEFAGRPALGRAQAVAQSVAAHLGRAADETSPASS
jgi:hypothetical protein